MRRTSLAIIMLLLLSTIASAATFVTVSPATNVPTGNVQFYYVTTTANGINVATGPSLPAGTRPITRQEYNYLINNQQAITAAQNSIYKLGTSVTTAFIGTGAFTEYTTGTKLVVHDANGRTTTYTGTQLTAIQSTFGLVPTTLPPTSSITQDSGDLEEPDVYLEQMQSSIRYMDIEQFITMQNEFSSYGVQADQVKRAANGNYYYDSAFNSDVMISISDGKVTTTRGTLLFDSEGRATGELDKTQAYTETIQENGQFRQRAEYAANGQTLALYQFGAVGGTWTVQVYNKEIGKLETKGTGEVILTQTGPVCACGTLNGQKFGVNINTGEVVLADGTKLTADQISKLTDDQKQQVEAARELHKKYLVANANAWERVWTEGNIYNIATFLFNTYNRWRGLGAYGALFIGKEDLAERRSKINEAFCKIGIGTDCITAKACERYSDRHSGDNTLITVIPGQAVRAAAHIQSQRTEATVFKQDGTKQRQWLYHTTFYASSPDSDNKVQINFIYDGGTYSWYPDGGKSIQEGGSASAQGPAALVKYSTRDYKTVCVVYANGIETGSGKRSQLCVPIVEETPIPSGAAPEQVTSNAPTATTPSGTPTPPANPGDGF